MWALIAFEINSIELNPHTLMPFVVKPQIIGVYTTSYWYIYYKTVLPSVWEDSIWNKSPFLVNSKWTFLKIILKEHWWSIFIVCSALG